MTDTNLNKLISADVKFWCDLEEKETDGLIGKNLS